MRATSDKAGAAEMPIKWCRVCGRKIEWRRKWIKNWAAVAYCSEKCRRTKLNPIDRKLEEAIMTLLNKRGRGATICPSEAAKWVRPLEQGDSWRELMEPARRAARRLAAQNRIMMTQAGRQVDPSTARGPVRLKLADPNNS